MVGRVSDDVVRGYKRYPVRKISRIPNVALSKSYSRNFSARGAPRWGNREASFAFNELGF